MHYEKLVIYVYLDSRVELEFLERAFTGILITAFVLFGVR